MVSYEIFTNIYLGFFGFGCNFSFAKPNGMKEKNSVFRFKNSSN